MQSSFVCIDYTANGGTGSDIRKTVSIATNKSQSKSFTLANNTFTRVGYKFKNWKVTLNEGDGEKVVGTYSPGKTFDTSDIRWHHSTYKVYAQWTKMSSITVSTKPTKTSYKAGETLNLAGGKITAKYSDGTSTTINLTDSNVKVTGYDNTKVGTQTLTVQYGDLKTTFQVTVTKPTNAGPTLKITSNPSATKTNVSSITYTFEWSAQVKDFDASDIDVTNGTKGKFTAVSGNKKFTLVVTNNGSCTQTVSVKAYKCSDTSGNLNTTGQTITRTIDRTAPTVSITSNPSASTVNASSITYTFNWSENVKGFTVDDISVTNGTKSTFSGSGKTYTLVVKNNTNGVQKVNVLANKCTDEAGNSNTASSTISKTIQVSQPKVTITIQKQTSTTITYIFQWDTAVTGFDINDIDVTNGTKKSFSTLYAGRVYQLVVNKTGTATPTVRIAENKCTDQYGNGNIASDGKATTTNNQTQTENQNQNQNTSANSPKVTINAYADTKGNYVRYVFQWDKPVTGFDINDIEVTNGIKGSFSTLYAGCAYQLFVKKSAAGTQTLKVPANVCKDADGNGNAASNVITTTIK